MLRALLLAEELLREERGVRADLFRSALSQDLDRISSGSVGGDASAAAKAEKLSLLIGCKAKAEGEKIPS